MATNFLSILAKIIETYAFVPAEFCCVLVKIVNSTVKESGSSASDQGKRRFLQVFAAFKFFIKRYQRSELDCPKELLDELKAKSTDESLNSDHKTLFDILLAFLSKDEYFLLKSSIEQSSHVLQAM